MTNLKQWDFAEVFNEREIALLALGVDPVNSSGASVYIARSRIADDYRKAINWLSFVAFAHSKGRKWAPAPESAIVSKEIANQVDALELGFSNADDVKEWINGSSSSVDDQVFARSEVHRWLQATGLDSAYEFSSPSPVLSSSAGRWPWGDHHTEALGHLEAAAKEFWRAYDPAQPATAPKNLTVSNWLQERGVTKDKADAIASILRADGLPTGPRK